jgi:hypothetical protein
LPYCQRTPAGHGAEGEGVEPSSPSGVRCSRAPRQPVSGCLPYRKVHPGVEPGLPPYQRGVQPQHLKTFFSGAYGCRSRTFPSTGGRAEPLHQSTETNQARNSHSVRGHHLTGHQPGRQRPAHRLGPVWLAPSAVRRYSPARGPAFSPAFSSGVGCFLRRGCPRPRWLGPAALFYPPLYVASVRLFQLGSRDSNPDFPGNNRARYLITTHPSRSEHPAGLEPARPAWEAGRLTIVLMGAAVVREGVAPTASGVSDRRAPVTPPDLSCWLSRFPSARSGSSLCTLFRRSRGGWVHVFFSPLPDTVAGRVN